jgi:hypothetical protein
VTDPRVTELGRRQALLARMRNVAREATGDEPVRRAHLTVAIDRFLVRLLHAWPPVPVGPPAAWARQYASLRKEMGLEPATAQEAHEVLMAFLEPVLKGTRGRQWDPATGSWRP